MKKIKQLFTIIAVTIFMLTSFSGSAQITNPEGYSLEIPAEFKMSANEKKENKLTTASKYDKNLGGYVYVTGYVDSNGNTKLESILVPKTMKASNDGCPNGYRTCARGCNELSNTFGIILCIGYCVIDCSEVNQQFP